MSGRSASGDWQQVLPVPAADADAQALRQLWARQRIQQLGDDEALRGGNVQREAITRLGLEYSLLTNYTSFIAVDRIVRSADTPSTTVNQPLPLPQGVSNAAVGAAVPSTPEPAAWIAMLVALGLVAVGLRRQHKHR